MAQSLHIGLFLDALRSPTFWYRQAIYFDRKRYLEDPGIPYTFQNHPRTLVFGTPKKPCLKGVPSTDSHLRYLEDLTRHIDLASNKSNS